MSAPMPLIKVNDTLRINLFNVSFVECLPSENGIPVVAIHTSDGHLRTIRGEEAERFIQYFDSYCEKTPGLEAPPEMPATADGESLTGRDFGGLVSE